MNKLPLVGKRKPNHFLEAGNMYEPTAGAHNPVPATPLCSYHATEFTQTSLLFAQFSREFLISDKSLGRTARPT